MNDELEIKEHFRRQSKISTFNYDENRKLSFAKLLKKESTENVIYEALGIIKNKNLDENSNKQFFKESLINYDLPNKVAELNTNSLNIANIIDLSNINNSNLNFPNDYKYTEDLKKKNCIYQKSGYALSPNNSENEFYLEIEKNNFFANESKSNLKRHSCNNNTISVLFSENSEFTFKNENIISETLQRPRKNTISNKTHIRLKNLIQNSEKVKVSENIQFSINEENRSTDLIDINNNLKISNNILEENLQNKCSDENFNLKHFNSCDNLNINENHNFKNKINEAVLFTNIIYDDKNTSPENQIIIQKEYLNRMKNLEQKEENKNKDQICKGKGLVFNKSNLNVESENINNTIYEDINSSPDFEVYKNGNNKMKEGTDNSNKIITNEISKTILSNIENKKKVIINDETILFNIDESIKEFELTNIKTYSKSFYKLKTINEELESNCGSSNFPDNKFIRKVNINKDGDVDYSKRKFSENIGYNNTDRYKFQSHNFNNYLENLSSIKKEIKLTIIKKSKSLDYFDITYKNKLKKTILNENEEDNHNKSISTFDDFSKYQHILNLNKKEI